MEISELPPKLQQLCFLRQREQGNIEQFTGNLGFGKYSGNFDWCLTPEGEDFWSNIDRNNIPKEYMGDIEENYYEIF